LPLDHVAILHKSSSSQSGLLEKILTGEKKIESRWYSARFAPWNRIFAGDIIYFKYAGRPIVAKAQVEQVQQFLNLTPERVKHLWTQYGKQIVGLSNIKSYIAATRDKRNIDNVRI
jgi:hypothetical protein